MSNWEKVIQDKELLSKVEDWVKGLTIDSPQEIIDEMNRLTGNDWSREQYESHIFDYPDFYDWEEVAYALFHDGHYLGQTDEEYNQCQCWRSVKYWLTFMFDWRSGVCLWADNDAAKAKFNGSPVETCDLPISDGLKLTLEELIYLYDESLNPEEPNGDLLWNKNQIEEFLRTARESYDSLCEELGPEYGIKLILDDFDDALAAGTSDSTLTITIEDGEVKVTGSLNLGYIGTYTDSQIKLDDTLEEIREWDIVTESLDEDCTDEELIAFLNRYFNEFAKKITRNRNNINGTFLLQVLMDMDCNETDFMVIDDLFIEEKLFVYGNEEDITEIYNTVRDGLNTLAPYLETPNDGSIPKWHIETVLRALYPMFNFDCFIDNIVPEYMGLHDGGISFRCTDAFDEAILCGAYAVLNEELCFTDWHNFLGLNIELK